MVDWTYDVFLSFRGIDIRQRFIGHLYEALRGRGIHSFLDYEEIERGEHITRSLVKAIEESRVAIPVFSANYAASSFCLDELVKIMECAEAKGQQVLPVFYEVDPSHVRHQRGSYGEALAKHEERFQNNEGSVKARNMERLKKWKMALKHAADLSGEHFKLGGESECDFIEKIVKVVSKWIRRASLHVADHLVGWESQVLKVNSLLDVGSDDEVYMVGIHGIGGIGKTTLARAVYNSIADSFEGACFLGNVRENSMALGLVHLQEVLLTKLARKKDIKLADVNEGMSMIKKLLCIKKVLLIIDDVDKLKQLRAIVGDCAWFGLGSRVIITTRDKGLLASHGVTRIYEVEKLNDKDALDLLRWNAFKTEKFDPSYAGILNRTVAFVSGLPLALEIIGSNMFGRSKEEWESALEQYKRTPHKEIQQILKVSFDNLEKDEQNFFLDIACFFNGSRLEYVEEILHIHHGVCPKNGIRVLVDKSLVKIDNDNVTLHDLIQDMGREIVHQESLEESGKRSRLWFLEDIRHILEEDKGSSKIEAIKMTFSMLDEKVKWDGEAFKKMDNLKTLIIEYGHCLKRTKHLPSSLRVLEWHSYPSQVLPSDFDPKKLVRLKLPSGRFSSLNFLEMQKKFVNLRVLNFDGSHFIKKILDVSVAPNLEELSFCDCEHLIKVHKSVGLLNKLRSLNAEGCSKLKRFPPLMLPSLEQLNLSRCSSLESFPKILGEMEKLTELYFYSTPIKEFPFSIWYLTRLQTLTLVSSGTVRLPSSIFEMTNLQHLRIQQCGGLLIHKQHEVEEQVSSMVFSNQQEFEFSNCNASDEFLRTGIPWFVNVTKLDLSFNNFTILPACIKGCSFLKELVLDCCWNLQEIRGIPPNMEIFSARHCTSLTSACRSMLLNQDLYKQGGDKEFSLPMPGAKILEWFNHSCRGSSVSFWFSNNFHALSLYVTNEHNILSFYPKLIINGHEVRMFSNFLIEKNHILVLALDKKLMKIRDGVDEWNHVEFCSDPDLPRFAWDETLGTVQFGLHLFKEGSSVQDIRFTDPVLHKEKHRLVGKGQQQNLTLLKLHAGQGRVSRSLRPPPTLVVKQISSTVCNQGSDDHLWMDDMHLLSVDPWWEEPLDFEKLESASTSNTIRDQDCGIATRKRKRSTSMLGLNNDTEQQSSIRKGKSCSSSAKIQKTATKQNHDKDSEVQVVETTIVPAATTEAKPMIPEYVDPPVNALMEIQPPSPQPLDPLAELERVLLGSCDLSPESSSEIKTSEEVVNILQNLEPLLDNPLESQIEDGETKKQILDCLFKFGQLEDLIPISLQSIVAQVRDFYQDLIHDFPSIQQTLADYSCLEETRSKFLENLKQAKVKQALIDAKVSREKNQVKELDAEIAELEIKLKTAVEKRNELESTIKNGEAEKKKILEDASAWLLESKRVVKKMRNSEDAYNKAQNSKTRFEGRLATLRGAFAANKP